MGWVCSARISGFLLPSATPMHGGYWGNFLVTGVTSRKFLTAINPDFSLITVIKKYHFPCELGNKVIKSQLTGKMVISLITVITGITVIKENKCFIWVISGFINL